MPVKPKILFDEKSAIFILKPLGMMIDGDGYIAQLDGERVLDCIYGEEVHISDLGGLSKNGIFKADLLSIMNIHEGDED